MADQTQQQIQALSAEILKMARAVNSLVQSSGHFERGMNRYDNTMEDANDQLAEWTKSLTKGRKLTTEEQKILEKALESRKIENRLQQEIIKTKRDIDRMERASLQGSENYKRAREALTRQEQRLTRASGETQRHTTDLTKSLGSLTRGTKLADAALVWFGATLRTQAGQLAKQYKTGGGVIETNNNALGLFGSLIERQNDALTNGLSGSEQMEISSSIRQTVNAIGGTRAAFSMMEPAIDRFRTMTLNSAEATKMAAAAAQDLAKSGIRPTSAALDAYTTDLVQLNKQTGMQGEAAQAYFREMAEDADTIELLRKSRTDEREAILANQRALLLNSQALGMSAQQAKDAAKMLNSMVAAKPLDRMKQAAKIRAVGGAMGISGADQAADDIMRGKKNSQAVMSFMNAAANARDSSQQQGLGAEIFTTQLLDKLDMDKYLGAGSPFSTSMADTLKPMASALANMTDVSKTTQGQMAGKATEIIDQLKLLVSGTHWLGTAVAGIAAILMGGKIMGKAGSALTAGRGLLSGIGGLLPGAAGGAGAVGSAGAAAAGGTGLVKGAMGVAGKAGVAGAVLDAGLGIGDLANGHRQTEMSGFDYISPMRYGMRAGEGINQGIEYLSGGESLGGMVYDWIHGDEVKKMLEPTPLNRKSAVDSKKTEEAGSGKAANAAVIATADGVTSQVKKLDASNDFLKTIAETAQKQLELAEKQLIAFTMTEREKQNTSSRAELRRDNKFGSKYGYV